MKKIWSIVSAVVLLAVLATGCGGGSAGAASKNGSFELEGKTYTLPFALTDLKDNGWEPARGVTWEQLAEKDIGEYTLSWVDLTKDGKEGKSLRYISSARRKKDRRSLTVRFTKLTRKRHSTMISFISFPTPFL